MFKSIIVLVLLLIAIPNQGKSQSRENLEAINEVCYKFYLAFETLDYKPMAEIHSKRLIRISGGKRITDYETYIGDYKKRFENAKKENIINKISLRFFERINNDSTASERGIYKLVRNKNQPDEQSYYGQFHVMRSNDTYLQLLMII